MTPRFINQMCEELGLPAPRIYFPGAGFRSWEWGTDDYFQWPGAPTEFQSWDGIVQGGLLYTALGVTRGEDGAKGRMLRTAAKDFLFGHWARLNLPQPDMDSLRRVLCRFRAVTGDEEKIRTEEIFTA